MKAFDASSGDSESRPEPSGAQPAPCCSTGRGIGFVLAALGLTLVSVLAGTGLARWLRAPGVPAGPASPSNKLALFRGWPGKPDLALLLSAQMHGYLLPCGCSEPQKGGLERRSNFLESLRARGWPVAALDLGDIAQKQGPLSLPNLQGLVKYRVSMQALKTMGYEAVSFGEYEASLPLLEALAAWPLQESTPRFLCANLAEPTGFDQWVAPLHVARVDKSPLTVGVTAILSPLVQKQITDPSIKFSPTSKVLPGVLKQMEDKKVDFRVLLYQGSATQGLKDNPPEAIALAKAFPEIDLILCLSESDEPGGNPHVVQHKNGRSTAIVSLGHKCKYVGVVGIYRTGKADHPFQLKYQLVEMSPEYATPAEKEKDHPILKLMEDYTRELKRDNYLSRYPQARHPMQVALEGQVPEYVGSEKCQKCHKSAYKVWHNSDHAHAFRSLENAKKPSLRQYDPECIVCHTVGFGYHSGYTTAEKTPRLKDVGCESCHGPASLHVLKPNDEVWHKLMNPWKAPANESAEDRKVRLLQVDKLCQKCHDADNDVTYSHGGFERKWPKIAHPTPEVEEDE